MGLTAAPAVPLTGADHPIGAIGPAWFSPEAASPPDPGRAPTSGAGLHGDWRTPRPIASSNCLFVSAHHSPGSHTSVMDSTPPGSCYVRGGSAAAPPDMTGFDWQEGLLSSQRLRKDVLDGQVREPLGGWRLGGSVPGPRGVRQEVGRGAARAGAGLAQPPEMLSDRAGRRHLCIEGTGARHPTRPGW